MIDFIKCIKEHSRLHHLANAAYWVCACEHTCPFACLYWASAVPSMRADANNQQPTKLSNDISTDPRNSSFYKAMQIAKGTLSIIDANATVADP